MRESRDSLDRLTTAQAASRLGISESGVRKRVQRGQMPHERDGTGRLWVYLDTSETAGRKSRDSDRKSRDSDAPDALVEQMQARIDSLERQLEQERQANSEHRRLLAAALERIPPQLEAPADSSAPDAPQAPERGEEQQGRGDVPTGPQTATSRRPWWRRVFGG